MFRSLVKTAFRNITNKFGYSFLNILGMTLGITSALFLILIAFAISIPAVWFLMNDWLKDFVYRYQISPLIFRWTILLTLIPTALTVSYQSHKAATANPADSIYQE